MLLVSQDGSVFRHFIILFGICLFTKPVICSVKLLAYASISLFLIAFQSDSLRSCDKVSDSDQEMGRQRRLILHCLY